MSKVGWGIWDLDGLSLRLIKGPSLGGPTPYCPASMQTQVSRSSNFSKGRNPDFIMKTYYSLVLVNTSEFNLRNTHTNKQKFLYQGKHL